MWPSDIIEIDLISPKNWFYIWIWLDFKWEFVCINFIFIRITWNYKTKKDKNNKWFSFNIN